MLTSDHAGERRRDRSSLYSRAMRQESVTLSEIVSATNMLPMIVINENRRISGRTAGFTENLTEEDCHSYFGLLPRGWTEAAGAWAEERAGK